MADGLTWEPPRDSVPILLVVTVTMYGLNGVWLVLQLYANFLRRPSLLLSSSRSSSVMTFAETTPAWRRYLLADTPFGNPVAIFCHLLSTATFLFQVNRGAIEHHISYFGLRSGGGVGVGVGGVGNVLPLSKSAEGI